MASRSDAESKKATFRRLSGSFLDYLFSELRTFSRASEAYAKLGLLDCLRYRRCSAECAGKCEVLILSAITHAVNRTRDGYIVK